MATARGNDFFTNLNTTVATSKILGWIILKWEIKLSCNCMLYQFHYKRSSLCQLECSFSQLISDIFCTHFAYLAVTKETVVKTQWHFVVCVVKFIITKTQHSEKASTSLLCNYSQANKTGSAKAAAYLTLQNL